MEYVESLPGKWGLSKRSVELMKQWNCRRGVLFIGEDQADAEAAAVATANMLDYDANITVDCATISDDDFTATLDFLTPKEHQESLLDPRPKKPCIVILNLDKSSPLAWSVLKEIMERGKKPACFVATARQIDEEHESIASFFHRTDRL